MRRLLLELKIAGINFPLVTAALSLALVLFAALAGELLDFAPIAFEVVFPLYAAIAVGEWSRFRSDVAFEAIAAQSPARFPWMLCRFFAVFATVILFALATMLAAAWVRPGLALEEMLLLYLPTAFFFASVAALVGGLSPQEHLPTLVCGLLWLVALLTRSLLRLPGVEYVYPFLRFAGDRAAAVGGPWAARGKTAQSGPSPHNPYTQTGESVVYYFYLSTLLGEASCCMRSSRIFTGTIPPYGLSWKTPGKRGRSSICS